MKLEVPRQQLSNRHQQTARPVFPTWQDRFRAAASQHGADAVLAGHRNAAGLARPMSVGAYLERNADVFDAVTSPQEALFHYLEFGLAEARDADPDDWDPAFVRVFHGLDLPTHWAPARVLTRMAERGIPPESRHLSEAHLWLAKGFWGPALSQVFEHEVYFALADAAGHTPPAPDRLTCLTHFCDEGLALGVPPHPSHRIAPSYYQAGLRARHTECADDEAPRHWARTGLRLGVHANARAHIEALLGTVAPDCVIDGLARFCQSAPYLAEGAPLPEIVEHLTLRPMPGCKVFDLTEPDTLSFMIDLARSLSDRKQPEQAEAVLTHLLQAHLRNPRINLDLADLIHARDQLATEIRLRRQVPPDFDIGTNQIILAERLLARDQVPAAIAAAQAIPDTIHADVALTGRKQTLARKMFARIWGDLTGYTKAHGVAPVQDMLRATLTLLTPKLVPPPRNGLIRRVAILANDDLPQCVIYRAGQKLEQLRHAGLTAEMFSQSTDLACLEQRLDQFDALILMRVPAFPDVVDVITRATRLGLVTFYDCDDLIFDASQFPPPLDTYAGQVTADQHAIMACGVPLFAHAMALCDYGIASTPTLQATMAPHMRHGQAFLHRNGIGHAHLRAMDHPPTRSDDRVTLLYATGTHAHKSDFHDILEPALARVLAEYRGQITLRIVGQVDHLRALDPMHLDVQLLPPCPDFETFLAEVARADINLSILTPNLLTDAKSEIKWLEAGLFAVPSVVSPTATYRGVINDGKTGFLCGDTDAFTDTLRTLIEDPDLRQKVGRAARTYALANYSSNALSCNLANILKSCAPNASAGRKPRLLIVNVFYPPQAIGGATRVVRNTVADLVERYSDRFEIDVITTLDGGSNPYDVTCDVQDGVRVWAITPPTGLDTMTVSDPQMGVVFDRLLDRIAPDMVHFHCIQHLTMAVVDATRRRDIPYVVTLHDGWWSSPNQFITGPMGEAELYDFTSVKGGRLPERAAVTYRGLRDAAAVLAVSDAFASLHHRIGLPFVQALENGLPDDLRPAPGNSPEGRLRVGHIGGATRSKGYSLLRAAVEVTPLGNTDVVIVDHAMPPGQMRREVWNGTPVIFQPRAPQDQVADLYASLDVLVAPSIWPESYGLVTREAIQAGLWVIASDRGAIGHDVVEGANGYVVSVKTHHALADCLAKMDACPEHYRRPLARASQPKLVSAQTDELVAIYERVLSEVGSPDN